VHQAETFKGILVANAAASIYAWAIDNVSMSAVFTAFSLAAAAIGWYVMQKEKSAERESRRRFEDALYNIQITGVQSAAMLERILHPETLLTKSKIAPTPPSLPVVVAVNVDGGLCEYMTPWSCTCQRGTTGCSIDHTTGISIYAKPKPEVKE
jgi:hypothetical protein